MQNSVLPWLLATLFWATPALGFGWQTSSNIDQGVFFASAGLPGVISLNCGGQQAGVTATLPMVYMDSVTQRGRLHLGLTQSAFSSTNEGRPISGAALLIDGLSYSLGDISYTDYYGEFHQAFDMDAPIIGALMRARSVSLIEGGAVRGGIPVTDMQASIRSMVDFCTAEWNGLARAAPIAPLAATAPPMERLVAWMERACPTGLQRETGALFGSHDLDGDGQADAVLDPRGTTCDGLFLYCGAMLCTTPVFLSTRPGPEPSDEIFGHGPVIGVRAGGLAVLEIHMRCADGSFDCPRAAFRWQNGQAIRLP